MFRVFHHMEAFSEAGSTYGTSATKALGRPSLDRWEMFTRETLQNSWDARDENSFTDGVTFAIDYTVLTGAARNKLADFFGTNTTGLENSLGKFLQQSSYPLLLVSDTGTVGLRGPTSAAAQYQGRDDFVSFVRNIGRNASKAMKGGTYGFGKGVFFDASQVGTVLIYTRTVNELGNPETRFIAMANSESYCAHDTNYTGRHWWGVETHGTYLDRYAEPFRNQEADSLASQLGMDRYFSDEQPTGTCVAVLDPAFDTLDPGDTPQDEQPQLAMEAIAKALTKWAWPHMLGVHKRLDPITFRLSNQGRNVPIPDPATDVSLKRMVAAYRVSEELPEPAGYHEVLEKWVPKGRIQTRDITSKRPPEYLGRLYLHREIRPSGKSDVTNEQFDNHIALIRNPRMVVKYLAGQKDPNGGHYSGVFIASSKLDPLFAACEPPAHDKWEPSKEVLEDPRFYFLRKGEMKPRTSHPVNIALTGIKNLLKESTGLDVTYSKSESDPAISALSSDLAKVVSLRQKHANKQGKSKPINRSGYSKKPRLGITTDAQVETFETTSQGTIVVFKITAHLSKAAAKHGGKFRVTPVSVVEGKRYSTAEDGIQLPKLLAWIDPFDPFLDWESLANTQPALGIEEISLNGSNPKDLDWEGYIALLQPQDTAATLVIKTSVNQPDVFESEE